MRGVSTEGPFSLSPIGYFDFYKVEYFNISFLFM